MAALIWISNLPLTPAGGGTLAVNFRCREALGSHFEILDTPPIPVRGDSLSIWVSRLRRRLLRRPGSFPVFSPRRLEDNARQIDGRLPHRAGLIFFKGTTPWIGWKPDRPYVAYTDVAFYTFFENTFDPADFHRDDIARILEAERLFLERADAVFFESQWGLDKTREAYGLDGRNLVPAGRGGNLPVPEADGWDGRSLRLVTMAKHFRQKGGDLVQEAYLALKAEFPNLSWSILGGEPDFDWRTVPGVTWEGFLSPAKPEELLRMQTILGHAFLLLHPTREDTNPLVITEAAAYGCPCVSVRKFAIPELVRDGETGILLDAPATATALTGSIRSLLEDRPRYLEMRAAARAKGAAEANWGTVAGRIAEAVMGNRE